MGNPYMSHLDAIGAIRAQEQYRWQRYWGDKLWFFQKFEFIYTFNIKAFNQYGGSDKMSRIYELDIY